jgi:hypothetical protein
MLSVNSQHLLWMKRKLKTRLTARAQRANVSSWRRLLNVNSVGLNRGISGGALLIARDVILHEALLPPGSGSHSWMSQQGCALGPRPCVAHILHPGRHLHRSISLRPSARRSSYAVMNLVGCSGSDEDLPDCWEHSTELCLPQQALQCHYPRVHVSSVSVEIIFGFNFISIIGGF